MRNSQHPLLSRHEQLMLYLRAVVGPWPSHPARCGGMPMLMQFNTAHLDLKAKQLEMEERLKCTIELVIYYSVRLFSPFLYIYLRLTVLLRRQK
jgi:hypothetical protein